MANCAGCGVKLTLLNKSTADHCYPCAKAKFDAARSEQEALLNPAKQEAKDEQQKRKAAIEAIMVTTETHTDLVIGKRLGIVTAECAYGMNAFKDLFASIRNIVGGRSKAVQDTMRAARETVLYELKQEASLMGADAVIAVDLDYVQIGDAGWGMVMLVASGTAVQIDITIS
jgi:uncharacterized protein YbjQ (UPF0145 family)